jgi:hypothetical protein
VGHDAAPDRGRALFRAAAPATPAEQLALGTLASRGEPREVKRQIEHLNRE